MAKKKIQKTKKVEEKRPTKVSKKEVGPALPKEKKELVEAVATRKGDTGSVEVQVALLTKRVGELTEHLKIHKKDLSSRRGLLGLVNKRRKLLMYLLKRDEKRYQSITKKLGLTK